MSIRHLTVLLAGLTLLSLTAGACGGQGDTASMAQGTVFLDSDGDGRMGTGDRGLAGIAVSNGADVTLTDSEGRYSLPVDNDTILFVIKPTGYRTRQDEHHLSRFYYIHKPEGSRSGLKFNGVPPTGPLPKSVDFPLYTAEEPEAFDVLFFGDPQPRDQKELDYIAHDVVDPLIGTEAAFGVTLGDILFDDLSMFDNYNRLLGQIGIPWYNVIGNHDINFAADRDEDSDETFERVYGPAYYSFNYGGVHFLVIDDVHWMTDGERRFYRSGLSEKQLTFLENDLRQVPQDRLVVAMMHIPLVRSTPWLEPRRERLFRLLESREHCISLSGHTHHHEHVQIGESEGWRGNKPHHHIINVTVSGSWWGGQPDEEGIPHTMCADGTPNGHTVMHFDGRNYSLEYRAARRPADYQMRIHAPETFSADTAAAFSFSANIFNAHPEAKVEWRFVGADSSAAEVWQAMQKLAAPDPVFTAIRAAEQAQLPDNLPWRPLPKPMICPHLWGAPLGDGVSEGTYVIEVRATNPDGLQLTGRTTIRAVPAKAD